MAEFVGKEDKEQRPANGIPLGNISGCSHKKAPGPRIVPLYA